MLMMLMKVVVLAVVLVVMVVLVVVVQIVERALGDGRCISMSQARGCKVGGHRVDGGW